MNKKILIPADLHNRRLDIVVAEKLDISRSQAQKLLDKKTILLNDALPKKDGERVKTGDLIVILNEAKQSEESLSQATNGQRSFATAQDDKLALVPEIIASTPDYVVINKPSGLLVHPTMAKEKDSLVAWMVKKYPKIKTVGDDPAVRPGIVHRLDKEASGLMVVAKTQAMFEHLKNQFKNRTVEKEYLALAHGKIAKDWDEIKFPIARGENNDRMAARPLATAKYVSTLNVILNSPEGSEESLSQSRNGQRSFATTQDDNGEKSAHTEFFVEKRFVNFTLLRVIIHTGRMHQIRAHLLAYNAPLVGDPLYFQKKRKHMWDEKLGRLFLHSAKLGFTDLSGEKVVFESALPKELETFLTTLS